MAKKKKSDNEIIDELVAAATPAPELETLPEEVVDEIVAAPVIEVVEEKPAPAPKAAKKEETLAPGEYYQGKKISRYVANLGKKRVAIIEGKRVKVLKSDIVTVK